MNILLISLICTIVHIPAIALRYTPFKSIVTANQKQTLYLIYGISLLCNFTLYFILLLQGGINTVFYKRNLIFFGTLMMLANMVVIPNRMQEHIFVGGMEALLSIILFVAITYIGRFVPAMDITTAIVLNAVFSTIAYLIAYPLFRYILVHTVAPFLNLDTRHYWNSIFLIPIAMFVANALVYPVDSHSFTLRQFTGQLFLTAATVLICWSISLDHLRMNEKLHIAEQLNMQKEYYDALSDKVQTIRKMRHDAKHYITAIVNLARTSDEEKLHQFCNELFQQYQPYEELPYTGNASADGILYRYMTLAKRHQIRFQMTGTFCNTDISDLDLCVLLGNALDNALNACQTIPDQRFITVTVQQDHNTTTILVRNSFDGKIQEKGHTLLSRKRTNMPGIGIHSMRSICEKYSGALSYRYDDTTFSIMFYNL